MVNNDAASVVNDKDAPNIAVVTNDIGPGDSISNVGGKTGSSAGRSSYRSSRSSASSACLKAEAERAALFAMAAAFTEKHELEAQEEQIRRKKELLELQSQIAAHIAKVTVLKYTGSDVQSSRAHSYGINSYLERSKRKTPLRPYAMEFVPHGSKHQIHHPPLGGCNAAMPTEAKPKYSSHQYHHPPTGGSITAIPMEAQPKHSNHQFIHPPTRGSNVSMSTHLKDSNNQFNLLPTGCNKAAISMGA